MSTSTASEHESRVALDTRCLDRLRDDLDGNTVAVNGFVSTFVTMWPRRFARVSAAAQQADFDELLDSTLSIRSSSRMLGAVRLDSVAQDVESYGRAGDIARVRSLIPTLAVAGEQTIGALRGILAARR